MKYCMQFSKNYVALPPYFSTKWKLNLQFYPNIWICVSAISHHSGKSNHEKARKTQHVCPKREATQSSPAVSHMPPHHPSLLHGWAEGRAWLMTGFKVALQREKKRSEQDCLSTSKSVCLELSSTKKPQWFFYQRRITSSNIPAHLTFHLLLACNLWSSHS